MYISLFVLCTTTVVSYDHDFLRAVIQKRKQNHTVVSDSPMAASWFWVHSYP